MKKKIFAIGALVVVMSVMLSMPAFAARYTYSFNVSPGSNYGVQFSGGNPKDDNEANAYVHTQSGNLIDSDFFYFSVYDIPVNDPAYRWTNYQPAHQNSAEYILHYNNPVYTGDYMYLQGDTDQYGVQISGYWYS